jgi:hypothetical protein
LQGSSRRTVCALFQRQTAREFYCGLISRIAKHRTPLRTRGAEVFKLFRRRPKFDDTKKAQFIEAISGMLKVQTSVAAKRIPEDEDGHINRRAMGYIYGFIDAALRTIGRDMSDVRVSVPITYQVLERIFPGSGEKLGRLLVRRYMRATPRRSNPKTPLRTSFAYARRLPSDMDSKLLFASAMRRSPVELRSGWDTKTCWKRRGEANSWRESILPWIKTSTRASPVRSFAIGTFSSIREPAKRTACI